jgi:hypothetical protein
VESKDDVKKRLHGRSTDNADAVIHIIAGPDLIEKNSEIDVLTLDSW